VSNATCNGQYHPDANAAARCFLGLGFVPIPWPRGVKGTDRKGWQEQRPTADNLDQFFPPGEDLNIGLLLGKPSGGLVDVDLDSHEGVSVAQHLLPNTGMVSGRQGKPRSHYWYVVADPPPKASAKFKDRDVNFYRHPGDGERELEGTDEKKTLLLELRSTGGQTIVPPSAHPDGDIYTWHSFGPPAEVSLDTLREATCQVAAAALLARHWPAKGCRHELALALAGGLLRAGWSVDRAHRFLHTVFVAAQTGDVDTKLSGVADTAAKIGLGEEVTGWPTVIQNLRGNGQLVVSQVCIWLRIGRGRPASAAPKKRTRVLQPYRPFPTAALPEPLGEYVRQGAQALGCDPAYLALPALAANASAIGNTRTIRLKSGWEEPSIIWSAVVADSGTLKSPAWRRAVAHLFRVQKRWRQEFKEKQARYREELEEHRAREKEAKEQGTVPGPGPEEPTLQRVVCSDTTIEKLAELLEDNPRGLLVSRDELSGWLGSFTRYKGKQGGTDLPNWLEIFNAGTIIVDRKTGSRPHYFVERAAVSVAGGIQPKVLSRACTAEFLDSGGCARLVLAMPPKLSKRWSELEVDPEVERAYQDALDRLLALDFDVRDDEQVPHVLRLSPEGKKVWVNFYNAWAQEQAAAEGEMAAALAKLEAYAARFALLHHVVTCVGLDVDDRREVGPRSVEAGIALARWFADEARRVYATLTESPEEHDTRRLVEFIRAHGGRITTRQLMRGNCRRYPDAESAEAALAALVEAGLARWTTPQTSRKGGKPVKAIDLCMTHDTDDTAQKGSDGGDLEARDRGDDSGPGDQPEAAAPTAGGAALNSVSESDCGETNRTGEGSGVSSVMRHTQGEGKGHGGEGGAGRCHTPEMGEPTAVIQPPSYLLAREPSCLQTVRAALDESVLVGVDLETTGLDPRADRVRLLSLATDRGTYLIECFAVDPAPLFEQLAERELVFHNGAFDLSFLTRVGFVPGVVHDTMLRSQLLAAGTNERHTLATCVQRELRRSLDKTEQRSDWSGALTAAQLAYAALDVEVLLPLYRAQQAKLAEVGLAAVARIEERCLPTLVWMARHGVALNRERWQALARAAAEEADRLRPELDRAAPPKPGELFDASWNWDSPGQAMQALTLAGCALEDTADENLAAADHPLAQLLRRYRLARKRATTYGGDWLAHVAPDGRVYPSWRQLGAASGRMSCSSPNMQQLPRGEYRGCVVAPSRRVLVKADYSQIELRIAAKVSGDRALLEAYQRGEDLHTRTARSVLGIEDVTKQDRQLAKALNFGLLYGMGARGFRAYAKGNYGLDLTEEEAGRYRQAFFNAYPGLAAWHRRVRSRRTTETRTLAGRRRLLNDKTPDTHRLNTPVQGTGADGLKQALALLWERHDQCPGAFPVLAVHDEIVVECDAGRAEVVSAWLRQAMLDGMAPLVEPVPVEVEVKVSANWGGG
jgi:DNA polymerase I-like protein with 3'-5' exonuclease and polymerase domains